MTFVYKTVLFCFNNKEKCKFEFLQTFKCSFQITSFICVWCFISTKRLILCNDVTKELWKTYKWKNNDLFSSLFHFILKLKISTCFLFYVCVRNILRDNKWKWKIVITIVAKITSNWKKSFTFRPIFPCTVTVLNLTTIFTTECLMDFNLIFVKDASWFL